MKTVLILIISEHSKFRSLRLGKKICAIARSPQYVPKIYFMCIVIMHLELNYNAPLSMIKNLKQLLTTADK